MASWRIALLTEKYPPDAGGLAVSVQRLARLLTGAGMDVHVFCLTRRMEAGRQCTQIQDGITLHLLGEIKKTEGSLCAWYEQVLEQHTRTPLDVLQAYFITKAGFV